MKTKRITAVLVDDEPQGVSLLQNMLKQYCPHVHIIGTAGNVEEAWTLISAAGPELVFLDIEMPEASGFHLLKKFAPNSFHVIFTTAHEQYAIKAIRHSALDYLLKPISIEELKIAVEKATHEIHPVK